MPERLSSFIHIPLLITVILLSACNSKWEDMPDDELAAKSSECYEDNLSSAMIQVCKNYERECQRRRENGINVC